MQIQTPRPHQVEAIAACVSGLRKPHSRGQCIMACGTGKTLVGYEVAAGLKAKRLLTLVPSLLLVNQMIREYRARGAKNILSVCSDESAGAGEDAIQISVKELEADNTNDAKVARAVLDGPGQRIVVCTYQSLRSLAEVFDGLERPRRGHPLYKKLQHYTSQWSKSFDPAFDAQIRRVAPHWFRNSNPTKE